jgi:hypothetical protein
MPFVFAPDRADLFKHRQDAADLPHGRPRFGCDPLTVCLNPKIGQVGLRPQARPYQHSHGTTGLPTQPVHRVPQAFDDSRVH